MNSPVPRRFSIVIPVYNGAAFVAEAVDSLLAQTIDPGAVEIVVVDDGSDDGTGAIVDEYASRFDRVKVIHQQNGGVSSALNTGVEAATGQVIGFMGSDDLLSEDTLELVDKFLKQHPDDCELVAIPIYLFGVRTGQHWNNRKRFRETRIIDVEKHWNSTQAAGGGTFIKAHIFREEGLRFDPRLFISEDQTLNTQVILRTMKYGVVAEARYYNRRHNVGGSLVSQALFRREYYTDIPQLAYQRMLDDGLERFGYVPRYAQAMVAYDLSWRFRADLSLMDPDLEPRYRSTLQSLLRQLDVEVILAQRAPIEVRISMLRVRAGVPIGELAAREDRIYSVEGVPVYSLSARPRTRHRPARCEIALFDVSGDTVEISGTFRVLDLGDQDYVVMVGDRQYPVERIDDRPRRSWSLREDIRAATRFRVRVVVRPGEQLTFAVILRRGATLTPVALPPVMGRLTQFTGSPDIPYYRRDGRSVFRSNGRVVLERVMLDRAGLVRAELGRLRRMVRADAGPTDIRRRVTALIRGGLRRRHTWLIADHKSEAGDNGEAIFRYLCDHPIPGVEPCFVLRREAPEYAELSRLGKVVVPGSAEHLRRFIEAQVVMNSAADNYMLDVLGGRVVHLNDLPKHLSVFLQHGVTKDDQSAWLNRSSKGFDVFVTSSPAERMSIVDGDYGYRPEQVVLTGMPRFDRLTSEPTNLIVFAPTWRKALAGQVDLQTGRVGPSEVFRRSEYFALWQSVISDERLNRAMRAHGYTGVFALHPSHSAEVPSFEPSERISIGAYPHDYSDFFRRGSVLVTDYSSVAFDFAYLRKPVIYAQGDREAFFEGHLYNEGYFSYEDDGFGPVTRTSEELIDSLVSTISRSSEMSAEYHARADRFFAFSGGGNSRRVCEAIQAALARDAPGR